MRTICLIIIIAFFATGCVKEDHFGKSNRAEIKSFLIPGQSGNTIISNDSLTVVLQVPDTTTDFNLAPSEITVSNFAVCSPSVGEVQDFSSPVDYTVMAEDGATKIYSVSVERGGSQPQLENASFENWYIETVFGTEVEQPGLDANTSIWGTANRGLALGGTSANSTRQYLGDSSYVKMESVAAPALVRIAAATIFIGKFTDELPSVTDPKSNLTLGTPFTARPVSLSFSFKYKPGENNEDANGQALPYEDQCDIYLFLENRDGDQAKRVGTAWFRNGELISDWTRQNVGIKYGPLDPSDPWYEYAQPAEDEIWGEANDPVTHITILATSSFEGDYFNGAFGSTLELDNIVLGY